MEWIDISKINEYELNDIILIWQNNISDANSSRFQKAFYHKDSHFEIFPKTQLTRFRKNRHGKYQGYDLEGDLCEVTHFLIVDKPR